MKRKIALKCVMLMLIAGLCFAFGTVKHPVASVSLMQLIVNPEKYHGKLVRVIGVSKIVFEGNSIWFTKEHYKYGITKNALWIVPDYKALGTTPQELKKFNGKYVLMEGIFNKDNHGHLGMYSGSLEKVTRFDQREDIEPPIEKYLQSPADETPPGQ